MKKDLNLILWSVTNFEKRASPMTYGPNTLNSSAPKGPRLKTERQLHLGDTDLGTLSVLLRVRQKRII